MLRTLGRTPEFRAIQSAAADSRYQQHARCAASTG